MAIAVRPPHEHSHIRPLTYDEVRQFPDDGYRYELVDGDLLVTPAPNTAHQRAITQLIVLLAAAVPDEMETLVRPVDWYVRPTTYFEPDLVVVRRDARSDAQRHLRNLQGVRTVGTGNAVFRTDKVCQLLFQLIDFRPQYVLSMGKNSLNTGIDLIFDARLLGAKINELNH